MIEIAKAVDVPRTTLQGWCTPELLEEVRTGTSGVAVRQLKSSMLADMTRMAAKMLTLADQKATDQDAKSAKEASIAAGIFIDKTLLLAGQATNRTEQVKGGADNAKQLLTDALAAAGITLPRPTKQAEIIEAEYTVRE
jgi:hypothetical protein